MTKKSNSKKDTVKVDVLDLYRLLLSEERYGCSRNNHLMPSCGFDTCRKYVELMLKSNENIATHTAMQLCDEVISELTLRFFDGDDDEYGNRQEYIKFIQWCLEFVNKYESYKPYNYDLYERNVALDDEPKYLVKDLDTNEVLNTELLTKNNYIDFIAKIIGANEFTYRQEHTVKDNKVVSFTYHILTPTRRNFYVYKEERKND